MDEADRTAALFRDYRERLARFARHLVGKGADADDLVQETFLRAHDHLCHGKEIHAPLSFLFVTMRNLVNDASRRRRNAPVEASLDADEIAAGDDAPSVERQAMSEREFENLCMAIAQLPKRMRYAFVLRKVYGYSCREIAEHLGRSTNTVRDQVAQSFKKLHALQQGNGPSRPRLQSATQNKREPSNVNKSDHLRSLGLAPVANRESSG